VLVGDFDYGPEGDSHNLIPTIKVVDFGMATHFDDEDFSDPYVESPALP